MFQEFASTWGMTVRPTVMPAIMSETNHSKLYLGSQVRIGIRLFTFFTKNKNSLSPCQTNLLEKRLDSPVFLFDQQPSLEGLGLWIKRLLKRFFGGHHPFWKCLISSPSIITAFPSPGPPLSVFPLPPCCSPAFSHLDQKQKYHIAFSQIPINTPNTIFTIPSTEQCLSRTLFRLFLHFPKSWSRDEKQKMTDAGFASADLALAPQTFQSRLRTWSKQN